MIFVYIPFCNKCSNNYAADTWCGSYCRAFDVYHHFICNKDFMTDLTLIYLALTFQYFDLDGDGILNVNETQDLMSVIMAGAKGLSTTEETCLV